MHAKKSGKRSPLHMYMADGGVIAPPQPPVSPYSILGIGRGISNAYDSLTAPFRKPAGYEAALQPQAPVVLQPIAPVTPARPQLGGVNTGVIQRREAAAGLADGGVIGSIKGAYDSLTKPFRKPEGYEPALAAPKPTVATQAPAPAAPVRAIGGMNLDATKRREAAAGLADGAALLAGPGGPTEDKIDAKLSAGEAVLPADTVAALGADTVKRIIDATHTPTGKKNPGIRDAFDEEPVEAADGFMPGTRNVMRLSGQDAEEARQRGDYGTMAGHVLRGTRAMPAAIIDDVFLNPGRELAKAVPVSDGDLNTGVRNMTRTFMTGEPGPAQPTSPLRSSFDTVAANPRDAALQAGTVRSPVNTVPGTDVVREGNSFSNTGEMQGRPGVNVIPTSDEAMGRTQRAAAIDATNNKMRMGLRDYGDADYYTTGAGANGGAQAKIIGPRGELDLRDPAYLAARSAEMTRDQRYKGLSANQRAVLESQNEINERNNATADTANQRNVDASIRNANLDFERGERRDATTRRGQDMDSRSRTAKAIQDQANSDRQFDLEKQKYGTDVAEKNRVARSATEESMRKTLETRFRTKDEKGNDVADTAKVAAFSTALSTTLPAMIDQLEASGKPEAKTKAKQLRERGAAALEPGDLDGMQRLFDTRERMRAAKGMGPNQGEFVESDNLMDYRQTGTEKRVIGGDRVKTAAGGSVSIRDLEYADGPANAVLPDWFKQRSNNLTRGIRME